MFLSLKKKNFIVCFVIGTFFLKCQNIGTNNDILISDQNIVVNGSRKQPLHVLLNESIYPYRIIQIGNIVDRIFNRIYNRDYSKYVFLNAYEKFKIDKDKKDFLGTIRKVSDKKKNHMLTKLGSKKIKYGESVVKDSIQNIKNYFIRYGFLDVKIKAKVIVSKEKYSADVIYFVETGDIYRINTVEIKCLNSQIREIIQNYIQKQHLKNGKELKYQSLEKIIEDIYNYLRNNGFLYFQKQQIHFYLCKNQLKKTVDIVIYMSDDVKNSNIQYRYKDITFKGFYKGNVYDFNEWKKFLIKRNVLRKISILKTNDLYSKEKENLFYEKLYGSGIFRNLNIEKNIVNDEINSLVLFDLNKKFNISGNPNFSIGKDEIFFSTNFNFSILNSLKIMDTFNIKFDFECDIFDYSKKSKITFSPKFLSEVYLKYPFSWIFAKSKNCSLTQHGISFNRYKDDEKEFNQNLIIFNIYTKYKFSFVKCIKLDTDLTYFSFIEFKEKNKRFKITNHNLKILFNYYFKDFFNFNLYLEGGLNCTFKKIRDSRIYWKVIVEPIWNIKCTNSFDIRVRLKIGRVFLKGENFPNDLYFRIGGNRSLRGWNLNSVGPGIKKYIDKYEKRGDVLLLGNIEFIGKFNEVFSLCGFFDIGNIFIVGYKDKNYFDEELFQWKNFYKRLFANVGLALRITWKIFVIRLDIGFRVYDPTEINKWRYKYFSFIPNVNFVLGLPF